MNHGIADRKDRAGRLTAACLSSPKKRLVLALSLLSALVSTAVPAAIRVGDKTLIPDYETYFSYDPVIAALADGSFVVVWVDAFYCNFCEPQGTGLGLFARQLSPLGVPLGSSHLIVSFDQELPSSPRVAAAPDGSYVVAWERFFERGVSMQRFRNGEPLTGVVHIGSSSVVLRGLAIASNGNTAVAWLEAAGANPEGFYWQIFSGTQFEPASPPVLREGGRSLAEVVSAGEGLALVDLVHSPRGVAVECRDSLGALTQASRVLATDDIYGHPEAAGRADGEVLVAWRRVLSEEGFVGDIRVARASCESPALVAGGAVTLGGYGATFKPGATSVGLSGWAVAWNRNYQERVVQLLDDDLEETAPLIVAGVPDAGQEFDQTEGWIAASARGVLTTVWNEGFYEPRIYSGSVSVGCQPGATTACLANGRFMVTVNAADFAGTPYAGNVTSYGEESADFWFFDPANREVFIKILNACDLSGNFWEFWSALSNVAYTLTVVDTQTGQRSVHINPAGTVAPAVLDANTIFKECGSGTGEDLTAESVVDTATLPSPAAPSIEESVAPGLIGPCAESELAMCLQGGRFRVEGTWRDFQGNQGPMHADRVSADSGYGWFFSPGNKEIFLKVLDACTFTGNYWVFAAGLTNVEVTLRVTDTMSGRVYEQTNALGSEFPPNLDVATGLTDCP